MLTNNEFLIERIFHIEKKVLMKASKTSSKVKRYHNYHTYTPTVLFCNSGLSFLNQSMVDFTRQCVSWNSNVDIWYLWDSSFFWDWDFLQAQEISSKSWHKDWDLLRLIFCLDSVVVLHQWNKFNFDFLFAQTSFEES